MSDEPVDLDAHRGLTAQLLIEARRQQSHEFQARQVAQERRQEELERYIRMRPAQTWPEAADRLRFVVQCFAATPDGRDHRYKRIVAQALNDINRLCEGRKKRS